MAIKTLTRLIAVPAVLASLAITGSALAGNGNGNGHGRGGPGGPMMRVLNQLELTADQEAMVEAAKADAKADREANRGEMKSIQEALRAELTSPNPDADTLYGLIDDKADLRVSAEKERIDTFLALQATFTPEQQAEFEALVAEAEARRAQRHADRGQGEGRGQGEARGHGKRGGPEGRGGRRHQRGGGPRR